MRAGPKLDNRFLFYWLFSSDFQAEMEARQKGASYPAVNDSDIRDQQIPLPPLDEQRRIVAVLDKAFAAIATATANAQKNQSNARALFESYLQIIFTERDEGWDKLTLKEASLDFGRGKSRHRPRNDKKLYGGPYPFVQTGDIRNCDHIVEEFSQTYSAAGLAQSKLWPKGTICITIAANIAETGILGFNGCFPDSVIGMVVDPARTSFKYVEYLLQSLKALLQSKGKGSAQANINLATFENERFPFPDLATQNGIVSKLDELAEGVRGLEAMYEKKLTALAELKQSLLQKAFAGELTAAVAQAPAANDNFATAQGTAQIIAFAYWLHKKQNRDKSYKRVKAQKCLHNVESIARIDLGRQPIKQRNGPHDEAHMMRAEDWARTNGFFEFVPSTTGPGLDFKKLANYDALWVETVTATKPVAAMLERAIDPLIPMDMERAELFATVHAAWNNLIRDGATITDDAIVKEARDDWHPSKLDIPEHKFRDTIKLIRTKGIVPDGTAKYVGGQVSLF
jgi:type I restriction enzyme, S subunit